MDRARNANDADAANAAFDRVTRAAKQIRLKCSDGGKKLFSSLLYHDAQHVASIAAFHLIPLDPSNAREALELIANGRPGQAKAAARITLKEWEKGRLDVNWFMEE